MFWNWHPKRMRLYHGSDQIVERPRILEPNRRMDFGKGFYTTQSYKQAERWARDVRRKRGADYAYVSEYEYNESGRLKVLVFDGHIDFYSGKDIFPSVGTQQCLDINGMQKGSKRP